MIHTIVIEAPDNCDAACLETQITNAITGQPHLYGAGVRVIEYHRERVTNDPNEES